VSSHVVTIIEGDGIGPEIMDATLRVLAATGVRLEPQRRDAGTAAQKQHAHPLPPATVESLRQTGVGLKGPLIVERHSPAVTVDGRNYATPNAALRGVCEAFANVRPARRLPGVGGRYADAPIDMVIVREVSEGIYVGRETQVSDDEAHATLVTTGAASRRVTEFACRLARKTGRRQITAVHKANVLDRTDGLFLRTFYETAQHALGDTPGDAADLICNDLMIDAAAARMVLDPAWFDVVVAPNQYGDILSDLAAALVGGLGMGAGGNYGPRIALFEACHGAAPDIAAKGVANPIALILSTAMMLEHLGESDAARQVVAAVESFTAVGGDRLTPDLGGKGTTDGVADGIIACMRKHS
jgi:isocitrate dehydrogenase (NAD+)